MKDGRGQDALVGGFVLLVVGLFVVWVAMISGRATATDPYHTFYERVPGLKVGSRVLFQGHQMGFIDAIHFDPDDRIFKVDLELQRDWPIPEDSVALIKASGLLSSVVIDIQSGSSRKHLAPGSTVPSEEPADLFAAITAVAEQVGTLMNDDLGPLLTTIRQDIPQISDSVQRLVESANVSVDRVNNLLRDENAERFDRIVVNAEDTSARLAQLSADVDETRVEIHEATVALNQVVQDRQGDLDASIADLQRSLEAVALHIDAITANLEATSRDAAAFSNQIRRDPSLVLRGRNRPDDPPESRE